MSKSSTISNSSLSLSDFIDVKIGWIGAVVMGTLIFWINLDFGWEGAMVAGMKQAAYTFFVNGAILRLLDILATRIENRNLAQWLAFWVPSILTIALVYGLHSIKGTPQPFESTLPTIFLAPPGYLVLAIWKVDRREA